MTDENATFDDGEIEEVENTEEESTEEEIPTEDAEADSSPQEDSEEEPEQDGFQKRINKLTAEKYEARRENEKLKERLDKLEGQVNSAPTKEPKLEDFDYDEDKFNEELVNYRVNQKLQVIQQQQTEQQRQETWKKKEASFATKEEEYKVENPDYTQAVSNIPSLHPETLDTIYSMDDGVKVAHYLGTHLDVADDIASLPPHIAALELGKIAYKLSQTSKKTDVSKAPEPVETISPGGKAPKEQEDPLLAGAKFE